MQGMYLADAKKMPEITLTAEALASRNGCSQKNIE